MEPFSHTFPHSDTVENTNTLPNAFAHPFPYRSTHGCTDFRCTNDWADFRYDDDWAVFNLSAVVNL